MASQGYQPASLDDILKTLSQFSSTPVPEQTVSFQNQSLAPSSIDPRVRPRSLTSRENTPSPVPRAPSADPTSITTWPQALKYVMTTLSQNESTSARIKSLIYSQRQHEKQWWIGRENLVSKQKGRDSGRKRADDLLRSLGATVASGNMNVRDDSSDAEKKELEIYDIKVYRALSEMSRAMDGELRALGVPFFAIKHQLVDLQSEKQPAKTSAVLSKDELLALQKQMIQLLQDLFSE